MFANAVILFLTALLLQHLCKVPTMPAASAKAPAGGRPSRNTKVRMITRLNDLHHCKDKTHYLVVKNFSSHLGRDGTEYVNIDYDLTRTARRLQALRVIIHRCPIGVGGECEYFNTWSWNMPVCHLLSSKGMMWTPTVQNLHPTFKCPLQRGSYVGRNVTADVAALGRVLDGLNIDKYSWPVEVQADSEDGLYMCLTLVAEARRYRVKEK